MHDWTETLKKLLTRGPWIENVIPMQWSYNIIRRTTETAAIQYPRGQKWPFIFELSKQYIFWHGVQKVSFNFFKISFLKLFNIFYEYIEQYIIINLRAKRTPKSFQQRNSQRSSHIKHSSFESLKSWTWGKL